MVRPVPAIALDFLRRVEGCRLDAYRDSGGVWTAGYGHTGSDVLEGHRYSQARADAWLAQDATTASVRLAGRVKESVLATLSDHQYAALVSFVFNLGAAPGWALWRVLNAGDVDQVPVQMLRFDKVREPNDRLVSLPGLAHRRAAEVTLWRLPDAAVAAAVVNSAPSNPSSGEVRRADTPPAPMTGPPLARSGSFGTAIATAVAAAPVAITQVRTSAQAISDAIGPYSDKSDVLQHSMSLLACVCAGLAVAAVILQWLRHRSLQKS